MGDGALLELAVLRLAVDTLIERGMTLVAPPVMVKERAMTGTGFFPLGREEAYGCLLYTSTSWHTLASRTG